MLAWLHQSIPTESENIHTFLKACDDDGHDRGAADRNGEEESERQSVDERCLEAIGEISEIVS